MQAVSRLGVLLEVGDRGVCSADRRGLQSVVWSDDSRGARCPAQCTQHWYLVYRAQCGAAEAVKMMSGQKKKFR